MGTSGNQSSPEQELDPEAPHPQSNPVPATNNQALSALCWQTACILAAFLCLTHAGMMLSLTAHRAGIRWVAPAGLGLALLGGWWLGGKLQLAGWRRFQAPLLGFALIAVSLAASAWYFDLSWDGQWYHQTAIYAIAQDWNPLADPMRDFTEHLKLAVRHYAKGPWYVAAAIYQTTGGIEWGKCPTILAWIAMGLAVMGASLDWGLSRQRSATLAALAVLNPAVVSELTTYMVDGIMMGFLTVVAAAVFSGLRRPRLDVLLAGLLAAIISINAKFTGLVFLCFVLAAGWLWCAIRRRDYLLRYTGLALLAGFLGIIVFGYNPYVTNVRNVEHPFYPVLGTTRFPSLTQLGREGIELHETPKNLMGRSRLYRLAYATFGRPGNQPYHKEPNATLMWPFTARPADLFYYRYHETRVAGFGPFFSGALLLSLGLGISTMFQRGPARWVMGLAAATILSSLLISLHLWWPRYGPQLWLLPLLPILAIFATRREGWLPKLAWALAALLLINALIVASVRMAWETRATLTLRQQLSDLARAGQPIEVKFRYFTISGQERLKAWGIPFETVEKGKLPDARQFMNVVEDYPAPTQYRIKPQPTPPVPGPS
jgi:hypothetical protein